MTDALRAKEWLEKKGFYVYRFGDWYVKGNGHNTWGLTDAELIAFARSKGFDGGEG